MLKSRKIARSILMSLGLLVICTGCVGKGNTHDMLIEHMEQKYGESFEYVDSFGVSTEYPEIHAIHVKCDSLLGKVLITYSEKTETIRDNYHAVKYKDEMTMKFQNLAEQVFGEVKVWYKVSDETLSPDLDVNTSFDEYSKDSQTSVAALIAVPSRAFSSADLEQELANMIKESGINCKINFAVINDNDYDTLEIGRIQQKVNARHCERFTIIRNTLDGLLVEPQEIE